MMTRNKYVDSEYEFKVKYFRTEYHLDELPKELMEKLYFQLGYRLHEHDLSDEKKFIQKHETSDCLNEMVAKKIEEYKERLKK